MHHVTTFAALRCAALLLMTMALAVALVACGSGPGSTGPAGPQGEQGPPGTTDPTDPQLGDSPVKTITTAHTLRFKDAADSTYDKASQTVDVSAFFHPATGLEYMVEGLSSAMAELLDVQVTEDGMLTVMFKKADAGYSNHMFTVKATADNKTSDTSTISVRRNRPPMVVKMSDGADTSGSLPRGVILVWVKSAEMEIKKLQVPARPTTGANANVALSETYIYTAIGGAKNMMDAFFSDDPGNTLTFEPAPMTFSDAEKLTVMGGEGKITLMGLKSTAAGAPIMVKLTARDDGGLDLRDDPAIVFEVMVDTAPEKKSSIGLKVLNLGAANTEKRTFPEDLNDYFEDDRSDLLAFYAWSSDPSVVTVYGNSENSMKTGEGAIVVKDDDGDTTADTTQITLVAKGRGTAIITVKAVEAPTSTPDGFELGARDVDKYGQSAEQTFMVEVN